MYEYNVRQGKAQVRIFTNELFLLMHIKNYLELEGNCVVEIEKPIYNLNAIINDEKYNQLLSVFYDAHEIELEYKDVGKLKVKDGKKYILNTRTGSIIIIEQKNISIYNVKIRGLFIDTYKAVRQLIVYQFIQMGALPLHSSSVALGGQGILFVGDKKAGKTTLSVKTALKYGRLCEYLGNDRMFIYKSLDKYYLYALPTVIGMGMGMVNDDKSLRKKLTNDVHIRAGNTASMLLDQPCLEDTKSVLNKVERLEPDAKWNYIEEKIWLTPAELSVITGCKCGLVAELKYLVIPEISNNKAMIVDGEVDAGTILRNNILDVLHLYPNWMSLPFENNIDTGEFIDELLNCINITKVVGRPEQIIDILDDIYFNRKLNNQW